MIGIRVSARIWMICGDLRCLGRPYLASCYLYLTFVGDLL